MRWTEFLIPTTKESPKDATAPSHILMLRAGLIRQLAAGVYTYMPLGYRCLRKIEQIVREEMNAAGGIELHMPVLQPLSLWQQTGREAAMGEVLLRLGGPEGDWRSQTVLGPTHEEVITEIARAYLNSYRQLPVTLYQIQTKFRGEARPKSGVLRTREFLMKDAYSFHDTVESLHDLYQRMYDAYCRIFSRCGLPYVAVEAESGPIGGDASHEFMVLTDAGEDFVALSDNGDYAANVERATCAAPPARSGGVSPERREVHTPGAGRVEEVCKMLAVSPKELIKTLIYDAHGLRNVDGREVEWRGWVVALVRGDHEVNDHKLRKVLMSCLPESDLLLGFEMATAESIERLTRAHVGFAGPMGLAEQAIRMLIDRDVAAMSFGASGANRTDYHVVGVVPGRDFPLSGEQVCVADIRNVAEGDPSPTGSGSPLWLRTAIEVGHVFKLGTKYSDAMQATFLTREGRPQPFIMGCYGIGLNRIMAAAIEAHHDAQGIAWPISIAPFEALVVALDPNDPAVMEAATQLHDELARQGVDVLLDDRDERAGFKFKDADLIGIPVRVIVGKKGLAEGVVELSLRRGPTKESVPRLQAIERALAVIQSERRTSNAAR